MNKTTKTVLAQSALFTAGTAVGASTHKALTSSSAGHPGLAAQVGSAMGAAAVGGAGVSGTVAAGAAVVTAKVAAAAAVATAAAPFVLGAAIVGGIGYGLYKIFED